MGIIMTRFVRLRFAAIPVITAAIIVSTTASGWAFSQQMMTPNGNYNFNYSDPDHPATSSQSTPPSDSNSSGFHFSVEGGQGQTGPFSGFQSDNHFFSNSGNTGNVTAPYFHPPGNN
jgi:hypothetical protein